MTKQPYPHLQSFLGAWFHQDFDLTGDTIDEIVGAARVATTASEAGAVRAEIEGLLKAQGPAIEDEFARLLDLDIDPKGFAPTVRGFLEAIHGGLGEPAVGP